MSDHDPSMIAGHPVLLLLPWYLKGTLSAAERQEVDEHLRQCAECREELGALSRFAGEMKSSWENQPPASPDLRSRVLSQIPKSPPASFVDAPERAQRVRAQTRQRRHGLPFSALAASVIVIQFAAILWLLRAPQPEAIPRGVSTASTRIKIVFQPTAREADIRAAVSGIQARIVDGPDLSASYTLQLPNDHPADTAKQLAALSQRKDLVQRIDLEAQ